MTACQKKESSNLAIEDCSAIPAPVLDVIVGDGAEPGRRPNRTTAVQAVWMLGMLISSALQSSSWGLRRAAHVLTRDDRGRVPSDGNLYR